MTILGFPHFHRPRVKPDIWGPYSDVQFCVRQWCENKLGISYNNLLLALPLWENSGNAIINYCALPNSNGVNHGAGWSGQGLKLDGADDHVHFGNESAFDFDTTTKFSIVSTISTVSGAGGQVVFGKAGNGGDSIPGYYLNVRLGKLNLDIINASGSAGRRVQSTNYVNNGAFRNIAGVRNGTADSTGTELYIDGKKETNDVILDTDPGSILNDILPTMGYRGYGVASPNPFAGLICVLYAFNTNLSADQVALLNAQPYGMFEPVKRPLYFFSPIVSADFSETGGINDQLDAQAILNTSMAEGVGINDSFYAFNSNGGFTDNTGAGDQFDAINLSDLITEASGINDQLDAQAIFNAGVTDGVGAGDHFDVISLSDTLPDGVAISDEVQAQAEYNKALSDTVGISDSFTCLNWSRWLRENNFRATKLYFFTLTGEADGVNDLIIPISSFQARYRNGESTYLSCVVPAIEYLDEINARSNGTMVIRMAYSVDGTIQVYEDIIMANLDTDGIRVDQGGKNQSITLVGHKVESYVPKTVPLQGVGYRRVDSNGKLNFTCCFPDLYLRPGDTATHDTESFTVGMISYSVSVRRQSMEVSEA